MRTMKLFALFGAAAIIALFGSIQFTHAADDCGGVLPYQGTVAPDEYTLTGNCTITGTLVIDSGTVIINGDGHAIDGDNSYRIFDVSNDAALELDNITLRNAYTGYTTSGGAIHSQGELTINNAVFANNVATNRGGAIYSDSTVYQTEITNSTFTNNSAIHGGAVYNHTGQMTIQNSSFSGNTASGVAGSVAGAVYTGMHTRIENSSFSDNSANDGGAISLTAPLTITSSTFSGNAAANGGTISVYSGLTLTSSIITNDPAVENCSGNTITDGGNNLIHGQPCDGIDPVSTDDPLLGAFVNGYFPLLEGSPAIDAYTGCTGTDQAGMARPQGDGCDIGAIEMEQIVDENTGEVIIVQPGAPAAPMLNDWMGEYQEETRGNAYGMPDGVYGNVYMWQGAWEMAEQGLPQELVDYGVIFAVDVWILTEDGSPQFDFGGYQQICLRGEGRMIFMDATQSPRTMWEMDNTTFEDGYTCGWIPNAGTVVLIEPE